MDIAKIGKSDLAMLDDDVAEIAKYHERVVAIKKPVVPPARPNYLVLNNKTGKAEYAFSAIALGASGVNVIFAPFPAAVILAVTGMGAPEITLANVTAAMDTSTFIGVVAGSIIAGALSIANLALGEGMVKPTLLCSLQRAWVRLGLPAKRLRALELKIAKQNEEYLREIVAYDKKTAKIAKQVAPLIEVFNAKSISHKFSFGAEGLVSTKRDIPSSILDLALESNRISNQKQIEV